MCSNTGLCLGTRTVVDMEDVGGAEARVGAEARAGKEIIVGGKETGAGEEAAFAVGSITGLIAGSITGMTESETGTRAKEVTLIQVLQTPIEDTALIPRGHIMIATDLLSRLSQYSSSPVSSSLAPLLANGGWREDGGGRNEEGGGRVGEESGEVQTDRRTDCVVAIVLSLSLYFAIYIEM